MYWNLWIKKMVSARGGFLPRYRILRKNPDHGDKNPKTKKIPNLGDKNPKIKKNPESRG